MHGVSFWDLPALLPSLPPIPHSSTPSNHESRSLASADFGGPAVDPAGLREIA
jgi:hypothetical protein